jgi:F1F0 ATPase subunit 2
MAMDAGEMTKSLLADHQLAMSLIAIAVSFAAGLLAGAFHYLTLWWNVRLFTAGGSALKAVAIQLARLALIATVLIVVTRFGALPLLAAMLGLLASRAVALRRVGAEP